MAKISLTAKFLFIFFLVSGCSHSEESRVKLVPQDKIKEAIIDALIVETQMEGEILSKDSLVAAIKNNYHIIAKKHGIEERQFFKTFEYYQQHPDKMDVLMTQVIDEMSKMEADLKGENESGDEQH